jgi:hypothetical protein
MKIRPGSRDGGGTTGEGLISLIPNLIAIGNLLAMTCPTRWRKAKTD